MDRPPAHARGRLRNVLFALAAVALAAPLLLGFFGARQPALDSFAHFRAHLAVAAAGLAALGIFLPGRFVRRLSLALLALAAAAGWTVAPFVLPGGSASPLQAACAANGAACPAGAAEGRTYTLLQMNLLRPSDPAAAIAAIARHAPDFVTLQEMQDDFPEALAAAGAGYPHVAVCPVRLSVMAILSRHPFAPGTGACVHQDGLVARAVELDGRRVTIVSNHLPWPWPYSQWNHVTNLADDLAGLEPPVVVGGDFNAAAWSAAVATFGELSGTRPVAGIGPTWLHPAFPERWRPWVGLPIDHVLVSPGIEVVSVTRLPATASDHLPVLVRFAL